MKTDKEISEYYIESAERHLAENNIHSIEKAVVHYKRAILFDPKNLALRKRLNEVFHEVSRMNKHIEEVDAEKNLIIRNFLLLCKSGNLANIKSLFSKDFCSKYNYFGETLDSFIINFTKELKHKKTKCEIGYFFIANRFNTCLIINEYILRFDIKKNKINYITTQKMEGADISNLMVWKNN